MSGDDRTRRKSAALATWRVLCRTLEEADAALALVRQWTSENGLTLLPEKTHIADTEGEGFEFLGYHLKREHRWPRRKIRVPLRVTDADVPLDLQPLVDRCYETGAYDDLDYTGPPDPPLDVEAATWANDLLHQKGLRR